MQSRLMSGVEVAVNIAIGYLVSVAANILVLPMFGYAVTVADSFAIGLAFTAVSLVRSYALRRWFNWLGR